MSKLVAPTIAITTTASPSFVQASEASTTISTTTADSNDETIEGSTTAALTKLSQSEYEAKDDVPERVLSDSSFGDDVEDEHRSHDIEPSQTTEAATEIPADTKPSAIELIGKTDRIRVVSKDDIDLIRGRALNLTGKSTTSGVIYVTAPPPALPKSSKSFSDDLSDVSMDNDGMDFHSSEHVMTTARTPPIHNSECQSKVCNLNNNFPFRVSCDAVDMFWRMQTDHISSFDNYFHPKSDVLISHDVLMRY